MKKALLFALGLFVLSIALPGSASAQQGGFAIKRISPAAILTPVYQLETGAVKRFTPQNWLEVEVEFSAPPPSTAELMFKYYVLINGNLLTGEVTHVNILGGQSLFSIMYVAPRTIASFMRGLPFTANSVQNVEVDIVKPGVGAPLAVGMLRPSPQLLSSSNLQQQSGFMMNKNETPFAPLYWDRYEAIKAPAGR